MTRRAALFLLMIIALVAGALSGVASVKGNLQILEHYRESYQWTFVWSLGAQIVLVPIVTVLSDSIGRRPLILILLAGSVVQLVLLLFPTSIPVLTVVFAFQGLTGSAIPLCESYCADITTSRNRTQMLLTTTAIWLLGFAFASFVCSTFYSLQNILVYVALAFALITIAVVYFVLPESLNNENRNQFQWVRANVIGTARILFSTRTTSILMLAALLAMAGWSALVRVNSLFTMSLLTNSVNDKLMEGSWMVVSFFPVCIAAIGFIMIPSVGRSKAAVWTLIIAAIGAFLYPFVPLSLYRLVILLPLFAAIGMTVMSALASEYLGAKYHGAVFGGLSAFSVVIQMFAICNALLYDYLKSSGQYLFLTTAIPAILFIGSILVFTSLPAEKRS